MCGDQATHDGAQQGGEHRLRELHHQAAGHFPGCGVRADSGGGWRGAPLHGLLQARQTGRRGDGGAGAGSEPAVHLPVLSDRQKNVFV